jgi:hypothetical protein
MGAPAPALKSARMGRVPDRLPHHASATGIQNPRPLSELYEPLTARQHKRLGRLNSLAVWRGIFGQETLIERGVEAKLAAIRQSMPNLRCDSAMIAHEKAARATSH